MSATKFKIGDKVKLTNVEGTGVPCQYLGKSGTICKLSGEFYYATFDNLEDGGTIDWYVDDADLTAVSAFNVGDTVEVIADEGYKGRIGIITEDDRTILYPLKVSFEDGDFDWNRQEDLRFISAALKPCFYVIDDSDDILAEHSDLEAALDDAKDCSTSETCTTRVFQRVATFTTTVTKVTEETRG